MTTIDTVFAYMLGGIFLTILAYAVVRSASYAYFRTRLEHMRRIFREFNGGK